MDSLSSEAQLAFVSSIHQTEDLHITQERHPLDIRVDTTIDKISRASSACLVDMYLREFIRDMRHDCLKPDTTQRMRIEDSVTARTIKALADPELHSCYKEIWREWQNTSFGHTLDKIAPSVTAHPMPQP